MKRQSKLDNQEKRKPARYFLCFTILLCALETMAAADIENMEVNNVRVDRNGKGYVMFKQPLTGSPAACGTSHSFHLAFDLADPGGPGILSLALAAKASGSKIRAMGTGNCDIFGSVETWEWGYVYE